MNGPNENSQRRQFTAERAMLQGLRGQKRGRKKIPLLLAHEWVAFVGASGMTDVRTMAYHPQSNGLDERFHGTFREEVSIEPHDALYQVQKMIAGYRRYDNDWRPHKALHCLATPHGATLSAPC